MASLRRQSLSVAALAALLGGACTALPPAATPRAVQGRPLPACLQIAIASTADHRPAGQLLLRLEAKQRRTSEGLMGIAFSVSIQRILSAEYRQQGMAIARRAARQIRHPFKALYAWALLAYADKGVIQLGDQLRAERGVGRHQNDM